jgi:hypothetical protein
LGWNQTKNSFRANCGTSANIQKIDLKIDILVAADLAGCRHAVYSNPPAIGIDVSSIGVLDTAIDEKQSKNSNRRCAKSNIIETLCYLYLTVPEQFLLGLILLVAGGGWLNARGIDRGPFYLCLIGWPDGVLSGVLLLLLLFPDTSPG